jgi:hypothetical protein
MKKRLTVIVGAVALLLPSAGSSALPKKKVVTQWKQVLGINAQADRWGYMQVLLVVRKRTTTIGTKKWVARRITAVRVPVWPNEGVFHTISLNRNLIPVLAQQVLAGQLTTKIDVVSEATDSSLAFDRSLQAALVKARKI